MRKYFDEPEIRKAVEQLTEGRPFEIRIIYNNGKVKTGYFQGSDRLIDELKNVNLENCNVYITLNEIHPGCYCRIQRDHLIDSIGKGVPSTSENDVIMFRWLLIDLDPVRPTGISSTDSEYNHSKKVALQVINFMREQGFDDFIIALSGNGTHILYKIEAPATEENKKMLAACLKEVDANCSDPVVKVDIVNFKKAQICKLYGTLAQKGCDTKERPFRMSKIISLSDLEACCPNE